MIEELYSKHSDWINIARSMGCKVDPEDVVQQMYEEAITMFNNGREVTICYAWILIRRFTIDKIREKNKRDKHGSRVISYGDGFDFIEVEADEKQKDYHIEESRAYEEISYKVFCEIDSWCWYDKQLFTWYMKGEESMRDISKKTNISLTSIFNTIKNCKTKLKEAIGEDWEDYTNEDFNKI